jgi:hypothetical protein
MEGRIDVERALKIEGARSCSTLILKEIVELDRPNWVDALMEARVSSEVPWQGHKASPKRALVRGS